jgi:hypothetical protein
MNPITPLQPDLRLEASAERRPGNGPDLRRSRRIRLSLPPTSLPPFHAWRP